MIYVHIEIVLMTLDAILTGWRKQDLYIYGC